MSVRFGIENPQMKVWILLHQALNLVSKCESKVYTIYGISAEQYAVLLAIKYLKSPVTPTDVAHWLDKNPNGISLIINRMSQAGIVRTTRDLRDRRSVRLVITKRGKEILNQASMGGWKLIRDILFGMNKEDLQTLTRLLEAIREKSFKYLNPSGVIEEINIHKDHNLSRYRLDSNEIGTCNFWYH